MNRAPFRLDLPRRHTPILAFVTDPDTEAQVPASMDAVITDTAQKKPQKTQPSKYQVQPPAVPRATLLSGQPHPDDMPDPNNAVYYEAVHRDSCHAATTAAAREPAAADLGHDTREEDDMGKPNHPLPPAAKSHHQVHQQQMRALKEIIHGSHCQ